MARETTAAAVRSLARACITYLHPPTHPPTHLLLPALPTNLPLSQGSRGTELDKDFTKLETERRAKTKTAPKQANRNPMSVQVRSKRKREIDRYRSRNARTKPRTAASSKLVVRSAPPHAATHHRAPCRRQDLGLKSYGGSYLGPRS